MPRLPLRSFHRIEQQKSDKFNLIAKRRSHYVFFGSSAIRDFSRRRSKSLRSMERPINRGTVDKIMERDRSAGGETRRRVIIKYALPIPDGRASKVPRSRNGKKASLHHLHISFESRSLRNGLARH